MINFLKNYQVPIIGVILILLSIIGGFSLGININKEKVEIKLGEPLNIEVSNPFPALLTDNNGEEHEELLPTFLSIDNGQTNTECPDDACGKGAYYPNIDVSSPLAFQNSTLEKCFNTDDWAGSQCWDLIDLLMQNKAGKRLSTGGSGKMKDAWLLAKDVNCTPDYCIQITNPTDIQDGDIVFFGSGYYGHGGVARGKYNNGYIALLGQNQGGSKCDGGGSATNLINLSTRDFIGAFRLIDWIPEPEPEPQPEINLLSPDTGVAK